MKTQALSWIISLGLTLICPGQDDEALKRFNDAFAKSEEKAIAIYPDAANHDSPLAKKMAEIDGALKAADAPLFYNPDKPYLLAKLAAKELGVVALAAETDQHKPVKYITADRVKTAWIERIPQPRTMDANYSKIMGAYREFVADIKAGKRDLDAQETAATYNKSKAIQSRDMAMIATFEAELVRISQAKSAAAALAQEERQSKRDAAQQAILNAQLYEIDRKLRNVQNSIDR